MISVDHNGSSQRIRRVKTELIEEDNIDEGESNNCVASNLNFDTDVTETDYNESPRSNRRFENDFDPESKNYENYASSSMNNKMNILLINNNHDADEIYRGINNEFVINNDSKMDRNTFEYLLESDDKISVHNAAVNLTNKVIESTTFRLVQDYRPPQIEILQNYSTPKNEDYKSFNDTNSMKIAESKSDDKSNDFNLLDEDDKCSYKVERWYEHSSKSSIENDQKESLLVHNSSDHLQLQHTDTYDVADQKNNDR